VRRFLPAICLATVLAHAANTDHSLSGYTTEHSSAETQWEGKFRALPEPARIKETMRRLSARPHHVGSAYDKDNAEWLLAQLKSYGLDAQIETFSALFPTPRERHVELLGATKFVAKLQEPPLGLDPTSGQTAEQLPTYNAYSRDGDVTAPLIYVNYGRPQDYEILDRMGISVKGAIVIARYGESWRGIKPKVAAEHGAVGCLIYSDPGDDGYSDGEAYPKGPMRPADGVQRGSVMDMPTYPGDPQTPGVGAVEAAKLVPLDQVETITKIPVLPISYADATPLLQSLGGETVPHDWRGALPFTYHVGPSTDNVHLALKFNWDRKPLYDVIARIPGAAHPDQWVIRGNHHDAWVNGAEDPISGASPELEEARALGEMVKQGWKPQRTIIYCFWDGEEPALLGSTEWGETHAAELREHAVIYINTDSNDRGFFGAEGAQSLEHFVSEVTRDIEDPETGMPVGKRAMLAEIADADSKHREELRSRADHRLGALGSGSDFSVFVDYLGIASLNVGYGGEDEAGQYHSIYDDFYWYTHFEDTDLTYGRTLAQTVGTMVMRMADADVLPFQFSNFAETIHGYVVEVKELAGQMRDRAKERDLELSEGVFDALKDPKKLRVTPPADPIPPFLNFAPLDQASDDLTDAAKAFDGALSKTADVVADDVNAEIARAEQTLTDPAGLPNRPWYRNLIYAPGYYTGYGVKTLPGVREAIEQKDWKQADTQIVRSAAAIEREVELLKKITRQLTSGEKK
jgi:N-acetylated-alpha-linked acidic dipeptidase